MTHDYWRFSNFNQPLSPFFCRRRYERTAEKTPKTIIVPRYEPVFVGSSLKEYETQVLQMSVPVDSDNDDTMRKKKANAQGRARYGHSHNSSHFSHIHIDSFGDSDKI